MIRTSWDELLWNRFRLLRFDGLQTSFRPGIKEDLGRRRPLARLGDTLTFSRSIYAGESADALAWWTHRLINNWTGSSEQYRPKTDTDYRLTALTKKNSGIYFYEIGINIIIAVVHTSTPLSDPCTNQLDRLSKCPWSNTATLVSQGAWYERHEPVHALSEHFFLDVGT